MDWFMHHPVLLGLIGAGVAVAYGLYLTWWLLSSRPATSGCARSQRAVQEGAAAYLKKQYTTIAIVAIVPFILIGVYDKLGWGTAFGFLIGAIALGGGRLHRHERRRALERAHRRGGARRAEAGAQRRLPRGLGDRPARRRPRPLRRHGLLLVPDRRAEPHADLGDQRPRRSRLRRLADLGLRTTRRRHLHEGRRRRRRPGRQDRGRASPRTTRATRP